MPLDKKLSSYDKICMHLAATQGWSDYMEKVPERLAGFKMGPWAFRAVGEEIPISEYSVDYGNGPKRFWEDPSRVIVDMDDAFPRDDLNRFVDLYFGTKSCPTYFCKKEKVCEKWPEFARKLIRERYGALLDAAQEKLRQEFSAGIVSDEFLRARTEFHERVIIDAIKDVLLQYKNVARPHILKQALDEYITHEVMDT